MGIGAFFRLVIRLPGVDREIEEKLEKHPDERASKDAAEEAFEKLREVSLCRERTSMNT